MPKNNIDLKKIKNFKVRSISISHLPELQEDVEKLKRQHLLDTEFSKECLNFIYDVEAALPGARMLLVGTIPSPIKRASFHWRGKVYQGDVPPTYIWKSDEATVKAGLDRLAGSAGMQLVRARLPVKTLAVRSGLAQYGRNNITYVPGYGSFHRLFVFATDAVFPEDNWGELKAMPACEKCSKCAENCPTKAIAAERFLLHAENCLTWHNEREVPVPDWIKPGWNNALIGCMRCQLICPVNKNQLNFIEAGPEFTEAETEMLLQKTPSDSLPEATKQKLIAIALDESAELMGRNLKLLIDR